MSNIPLYIGFTDLDGTLLDHDSYGWEEALPALELCKELCVPVVLVSSKTRAEMDLLRRKLSMAAPFVSENGGGIFFPREGTEYPPPGAIFDKGMWKWSLGLPYGHLVGELKDIRDELGWDLKGFSDMSIEEISHLTGLDHDASRLAAMREYDEPFLIIDKQGFDKNLLLRVVARRGLTVAVGGRFYHLHGKNDKGQAMEKVTSWYKQFHKVVVSIALGDSPNDFPMLERADYPVLIRSQRDFSTLKKRMPRLRVTREIGPKGWNSAMLDILGKKEEAGNGKEF